MSSFWTLDVMRAFKDAMNEAKVENAPAAKIAWPLMGFAVRGPYQPFVWFSNDQVSVNDGATSHQLVVVTGVVFAQDPSVDEAQLEQAIGAYYAMRATLAAAIDDDDSTFNSKFRGGVIPHPTAGGIEPSGAKDFDGSCTLGERWLIQTSDETPIPS